MKTKEFLRRVEDELGYAADKSENYITIKKESGKFDALFAMIAINKVLGFDTSFHNFTSLDKHDRNLLFDLILEYARTPLDEREEEKKYIYKLPILFTGSSASFIQKFFSAIRISSPDKKVDDLTGNYHFTDKEVEQYAGKARLLFDACEKIEVTP